MDFFSKLSKKANETYQATKERATNISEELKVKGRINEFKEKLEDYYVEIGKTVYSELKDGKTVSEEEILAKCDEISNINDEISKLKEKLQAIKKIKTCPNCGEKLDREDLYCSKCGKEQPKIENIEIKEDEPEDVKEAEVVDATDAEDDNK